MLSNLNATPSADIHPFATGAMPARPPPLGGTEGLDLIFISGLQARTVIGVDADELDTKQSVRIDLVIGMPRLRACVTDRREDTVDYGLVREALLGLMETHRVRLLEALAERVAQLALVDFGAAWVRVTVVKPRKFANVDSVGVSIERHAADRLSR